VAVGYVVTAIVTQYLHYFGLVLIALQGTGLTALLIRRPRALLRVAALYAPVAFALLPWAPELMREAERTSIHYSEPDLGAVRHYWKFLFYKPGELKRLAAILCGFFLLRGCWQVWRASSRPPLRSLLTSSTALVLLWLALPFTVAFVWSKLVLPVFTERNLIISRPAAYLLLARALAHTVPNPRALAAVAGGLAAMLLYGLIGSGEYYSKPRKDQFREAAAVVVAREAAYPGAPVVGYAWSPAYFDYYLRRLGAESRVDLLAGSKEDIALVEGFLEREQPSHFWFLHGCRTPDEEFVAYLDSAFEPILGQELYHASVRLYRRH
jgi:hypothetical protein